MTENPIIIPFDFTVEEAAEVLLEKKISGAPVVDGDGKIIGVITKNDLFRVLIALTGVGKRGIQFAFEVEDRPVSIRELADVIRRYGGRMVSILSTHEKVRAGYRKVFIRVYGVEWDQLPQLEKELGEKAEYRYLIKVNCSACRKTFWRASCLDTQKVPLPGPSRTEKADSFMRTAERCCWTKSATSATVPS